MKHIVFMFFFLLSMLVLFSACSTTLPEQNSFENPIGESSESDKKTTTYAMEEYDIPALYDYLNETVLILQIRSVEDETITTTNVDNVAPGVYRKVLFDMLYCNGRCTVPRRPDEVDDPSFPGGTYSDRVEKLLEEKQCIFFSENDANKLAENDVILCSMRASTRLMNKEWHLVATKIRHFEDGKLLMGDENAMFADFFTFPEVNELIEMTKTWPKDSWCDDLISRAPTAKIENGVDYRDLIYLLQWTRESIDVFDEHMLNDEAV